MMRRLTCLVVIVLAVASLAQAQSYTPNTGRALHWEFSVQTRYTTSNETNTNNGSSLSLDDDLGWGFGFGYNLNERFNLGFAFTWRSIPYSAKIVGLNDPTDIRYYNNWLDTSVVALTGEFNLLPGRITPYVSGNVGWLAVDTNIVADYGTGCYWDPWWGYICGGYAYTYGTDAATWGLGLGLRAELTPTLFAKVGWDHAWNDLDSFDSTDMLRVDLGALF